MTWIREPELQGRRPCALQEACAACPGARGRQGHSAWVGGLPVRESAIIEAQDTHFSLHIQTGGPALELMLGAKSMATNGRMSRVVCQKRNFPTERNFPALRFGYSVIFNQFSIDWRRAVGMCSVIRWPGRPTDSFTPQQLLFLSNSLYHQRAGMPVQEGRGLLNGRHWD
jgi:hypothetical protein